MTPGDGNLCAVILAAGASTRMGRPKALIHWHGRAFVTHLVDLAEQAGCAPIVVVEGADALPDGVLGGARRITNQDWQSGQISSLQAALRVLFPEAQDGHAQAVLVLTVDRPHVLPSTIASLVAAHGRDPHAVWQPAHRGRSGHPVLYPHDLVVDLLALPKDESARVLLARRDVVCRRRVVDVEDPAVLENLDRPEDVRHLR